LIDTATQAASCPPEDVSDCTWESAYFTTDQNFHQLPGGLVGGPDDADAWSDDRDMSSAAVGVSLLNNAGFSAALAGLVRFDINMAKCQQGACVCVCVCVCVCASRCAAGRQCCAVLLARPGVWRSAVRVHSRRSSGWLVCRERAFAFNAHTRSASLAEPHTTGNGMIQAVMLKAQGRLPTDGVRWFEGN
jgi:hypothetical protein